MRFQCIITYSRCTFSRDLQEFVSEQIDTVFPLREPLAALRLRFDINDGLMTPTGRLCWHLTLLGCTVDEGKHIQWKKESMEIGDRLFH